MTAQACNTLLLDNLEFAVVDASNGLLFDPRSAGLNPFRIDTSCYRGFICHYGVFDQHLILRELEISHEPAESPPGGAEDVATWPLLQGVVANAGYDKYKRCLASYEGLQLPLAYSGKALVSRNADGEYPPRFRGHIAAWDCDTSLLLEFEQGALVARRDVSDVIATIVQRYIDGSRERDQSQNAQRYLNRQLGRGFAIYPSGA
jgi:hypothetical protein